MALTLPRATQIKLRDAANAAVWRGADQRYPKGLPRDEVTCLRNLIEDCVPLIDFEWQEILAPIGIRARVSGVVCHGRPFVRFQGNVRSCELGDFLLVHDHHMGAGRTSRRASIVQAKVFYQRLGVTSRNQLQLQLYKHWPRFEYTDWPGGLRSLADLLKKYNVKNIAADVYARDVRHAGSGGSLATDVEDGCRYGMIEVDYLSYWMKNYRRNPWRLCSPHSKPEVYTSREGFKLGTYLARLIRADAGRDVPATDWWTIDAIGCQWSLVVQELLSLQTSSAAIAPPVARALSAASTRGGDGIGGFRTKIPDRGDGPDAGVFAVIVVSTEGDERYLSRE